MTQNSQTRWTEEGAPQVLVVTADGAEACRSVRDSVRCGLPTGHDGWHDHDGIAWANEMPYQRFAYDKSTTAQLRTTRCASCGQPDPDGPTDADGQPWCGSCADAGEVTR